MGLGFKFGVSIWVFIVFNVNVLVRILVVFFVFGSLVEVGCMEVLFVYYVEKSIVMDFVVFL